MIARLLLIAILCLSVAPAAADNPAQANRLLVEAAKLFRQANQAETANRLTLLEGAFAKLNEIIEAHPSSDLAVRLITDQPIGILSLGNVARAVCEEQIRAGKLQSALVAARLITDVKLRDEMLVQLAPAQARAGDVQGALVTAQLVSNNRANPRVDTSFRDTVLGLIAGVQAEESGDIQGAEATIRMIKAAALREQLLDALRLLRIKVAREAEETRRDACLESLDVANPACRGWLGDMVRAQLQTGSLEDALATAELIEAADVRDQALNDIAAFQAEAVRKHLQAGNFNDALATAKSIESAHARDQALHDVAGAQAQAGDSKEALAVVESIETNSIRDDARHRVAIAQVKAANFHDALVTAASIEATGARDQTLRHIAGAHLQAGKHQDALATAKMMKAVNSQDQVSDTVARRLTNAGDFQEALVVAKSIETRNIREGVLYVIGMAQIRTGNLQDAMATAGMIKSSNLREQIRNAVKRRAP